jgi:hypothetical protein
MHCCPCDGRHQVIPRPHNVGTSRHSVLKLHNVGTSRHSVLKLHNVGTSRHSVLKLHNVGTSRHSVLKLHTGGLRANMLAAVRSVIHTVVAQKDC